MELTDHKKNVLNPSITLTLKSITGYLQVQIKDCIAYIKTINNPVNIFDIFRALYEENHLL
jgi:hypothetical protein